MVRELRKLFIPIGTCPKTKKMRYTHDVAQAALADAMKSKKSYRRECRIYECPFCDAWHLTSKKEYHGTNV